MGLASAGYDRKVRKIQVSQAHGVKTFSFENKKGAGVALARGCSAGVPI